MTYRFDAKKAAEGLKLLEGTEEYKQYVEDHYNQQQQEMFDAQLSEYEKNLTKEIKTEIDRQYGSLSNFSNKVRIPASTLASGFKRGIGTMSVTRVIKICEALGIDLNTFGSEESSQNNDYKSEQSIEATPEQVVYQLTLPKEDDDLLKAFRQLNPQNKKKVQEYVGDLLELQTYQESNK